MSLRRKIQLLVPSLFIVAGLSPACTSGSTAQFIAGVQSQVQVPRDLKTVLLRVKIGGTEQFCQAYNVVDNTVRLPQSLGTIDKEASTTLPIEIAVIGISAKTAEDVADCTAAYGQIVGKGDVRVLRRTKQTYIEGRKLYVPMPLRYACYDTNCNEDETCKGGECKPLPKPEDAARALVDFREDLLFGTSNTCFPVADQVDSKGNKSALGCFNIGGQDISVPPKVIDAATCTFEPQAIPNVPFVGVNVSATFDGGVVKEVLDLDEEDGFYIPDPKNPRRFRLSPGLCKAYHSDPSVQHVINSLRVTPTCLSKTILQPICKDDLVKVNPVGPLGGAGTGAMLQPTKSGLVFLMDVSKGNESSFGEGGLAQKIVDVALKDPSLKTIAMGLMTLPAANPAVCPSTLDVVPNVDATDSLTKISTSISGFVGVNQTNLRNADAGVKLGVSSALSNAITQLNILKSATPDKATDRNAIVFIGSGPFTSSCAGSANTIASSVAASIKTYVVRTDNNFVSGTDGADALAAAGGTVKSTDASSNNALNALTAFADISAALTTCRYIDPDKGKSTKGEGLIEYFSPTELKTISVSHGACTADAGKGWTRNGDVIELCKESCDELRTAYKNNILVSAASGAAPLGVPVYLRLAKQQ